MRSVSIIIPVKSGGEVTALELLERIDYPSDLLEILVVEGRHPSVQRNRAAAAAHGDILYFLDDDSLVTPDFLRRTVRHYEDPAVAAVGGPSLTPETDSVLQRSIGIALTSILGGGGMRNRYRQIGQARSTGDQELILCNLSFRRDLFLEMGGLDERLYPNEENELLDRLQRRGGVLIHDPSITVCRSQRPTFQALVRQFLNYGRGRAEQTLISCSVRLATLTPALFILYLLVVAFFAKPVYYLPLLWYAGAVFMAASAGALKAREAKIALLLLCIFPTIHLAYGAGFWWGLLGWPLKKRGTERLEVTLRLVKGLANRSDMRAAESHQEG
jgi:succinoglycan biosynthesis protein ExoA